MPKCSLHITFDRDPGAYAIGESISGSVQVTAHEDCECRQLTVARQWRASGQGETDEGTPEEEKVIFSGTWRAGQTATYPFEIEAPPGPLTYHGSLFNVDWQLRARAEIPGSEATASQGFVLLPGASAENVHLATLDEFPAQAGRLIDKVAASHARSSSQWFGVVFGFVALFVGLPSLVIGLLNILAMFVPLPLPIFFPAGRFQSVFLIIMGGFFAILGCKALLSWFRAATARSKLGPVHVELGPATLRRGEATICTVRLQPRAAVELTKATASVVATEYADGGNRSPDGTTQILKEVVRQTKATLATNRTLRAAESVLLQTTLNLPPDVPPTFRGGHNRLIWTVDIELKLQHWPDWAQSVPLTVHP